MSEPLPWQEIHGWGAEIVPVYAEMVAKAQPGAIFIELGTWLGQSAAAMGDLIKKSGKDINFYTVDHGLGCDGNPSLMRTIKTYGGFVGGMAVDNFHKAAVLDHVTPIVTTFARAARLFAPNSIDFVFLDNDHRLAPVLANIKRWWPRLKPGGVIGGHDYGGSHSGVARAVNSYFTTDNTPWPGNRNCWKVQKPANPVYKTLDIDPPAGIGIITYNRLELLKNSVAAVQAHTTMPYRLVVCDDGSTDGTVEWCQKHGVPVIAGKNGGVCWNKNRALYSLYEAGCDPIILFEDDTSPTDDDWLQQWALAAYYWDHVNYCRTTQPAFGIHGGTGFPADPYLCMVISAQCTATSRKALEAVGYLDTRFKGYGYGHTEWTNRFGRANFWGAKVRMAMCCGLYEADCESYRNQTQLDHNMAMLHLLAKEPPHRDPWRTPEEKERFLSEVDIVPEMQVHKWQESI
jgi:hypothetical protein